MASDNEPKIFWDPSQGPTGSRISGSKIFLHCIFST